MLAKRGGGKTYTAAVMVEEMLGAGLPVVVVDPVGVWWGLRSSADGTGDGLPVVIIGGDHADRPLPETAGWRWRTWSSTSGCPRCWTCRRCRSAARRFMTDFAERLYHRSRAPCTWCWMRRTRSRRSAPTRAGSGSSARARTWCAAAGPRALGVTLITQRPAVLHKDVLTRAEVLVALRTGPRDVAAIDEWVRLHAEDSAAAAVKRSLPSLPLGTAWVWSPGWLGLLQRVEVCPRRTFDSSATPTAGRRPVVP